MWFGLFGALFGLASGLTFWIVFILLFELTGPLINTSNQAIWQSKVAPDLQGRVFSARRLIAWITNPISPIIGGTLADFVLEPAMKSQTGLSRLLGPIFGTGPGSGMSLLFFICGILVVGVGVICYFVPAIRNAETLLPDHDQLKKAGTTEETVGTEKTDETATAAAE